MKKFRNLFARGPTSRRHLRIAAWFLGLVFMVWPVWPLTSPVTAQTLMPHDKVERLLAARYGEWPIARGLTQAGTMIEVFAASGGETWTIVFTTPRGISRIGSAGVAWTPLVPETSHFSSSDAGIARPKVATRDLNSR